jgi:hypothetical protein
MNTGVKIALWVTGIAAVGVGGYFIWKSVKKKSEEKAAEDLVKQVANKFIPQVTASGNATTAQTLFVDQTANPFPNQMALTMFQNWVFYTKGDKAILGKAGVDGKWGKDSIAAWTKYKNEWNSLSKK